MQLKFSGGVKTLAECQIGELVLFNFCEAAALAFVAAALDDGDTKALAVLRHDGTFAAPFICLMESEAQCIAFGSEWIVEPVKAALSHPGDQTHYDHLGVLHMEKNRLLVKFGKNPASNTRTQPMWVDLRNPSGAVSPSPVAVPCKAWKVWVNEDDRIDRRCAPIFEFEAS